MKLQPDKLTVQSITAYGPDWVAINGQKFSTSQVISSRGDRLDWNCDSVAALTEQHFAVLAEMKPELVIFGSGPRLHFANPRLMQALMRAHIGIETMDTPAACRTYNILAAEGRDVVLAFLL